MQRSRLVSLVAIVAGMIEPSAARADRFELVDGDRVVLIGNTYIERDQAHGYLETLLTQRYPDRNITFRNLGWSGDTVWGEARAGFGAAADGFQNLKRQVHSLKPTVILVGYGMNESFDGEAGLPRFEQGLNTLLDMLAETKARIVLISPIRHEDLGRPFPKPEEHNAKLRLYCNAIRGVSKARGYPFVNLWDNLIETQWGRNTDNGVHLTSLGYYSAAMLVLKDLRVSFATWRVDLSVANSRHKGRGTRLEEVELTGSSARFRATDERLPYPLPPIERPQEGFHLDRILRVSGLDDGRYALKIDGKAVPLAKLDGSRAASATAAEWSRGLVLIHGPERDQSERLRLAINAKNLLYFHRWRPQNETYLFGFRKHEQGQNAREVPLFDPLVSAQEAEIARLKMPVSHIYELRHTEDEE